MSVSQLVRLGANNNKYPFGTWQSFVRTNMRPGLEITGANDHFAAELSSFDFAGARLWSLNSNAQRVARRQPLPKCAFDPALIVQLEGHAALTQNGKQIDLVADECAFIDLALPYVIHYADGSKQLHLQLPDKHVERPVFRDAALIKMNAARSTDRPLLDCTRDIWAAAPELSPLQHGRAVSALVSLCSLTSAFQSARLHAETPVRVARAMKFIESRLSDPHLSAHVVAQSQGVSRRYLDELFGQRGHRIESWIWERRANRAAEDIQAEDGRSFLQIALDLGFQTHSHFSRRFARQFGMSPRDYRRQYRSGGVR